MVECYDYNIVHPGYNWNNMMAPDSDHLALVVPIEGHFVGEAQNAVCRTYHFLEAGNNLAGIA